MRIDENRLSIVQVILGILTIVAVSNEWSAWWIPGVPWVVVSFIGIVLTLPLVFVIGLGAGCAQADWMSDGFIMVLCFVIPTTLAVGANYGMAWWRRRLRAGAITRGDEQPPPACCDGRADAPSWSAETKQDPV